MEILYSLAQVLRADAGRIPGLLCVTDVGDASGVDGLGTGDASGVDGLDTGDACGGVGWRAAIMRAVAAFTVACRRRNDMIEGEGR